MREMKAKVEKIGARLKLNGVVWSVVAYLFTDDMVLLAESKRELKRVVDQYNGVCVRRKLKVNVRKSKVLEFERKEIEVVDLRNPYRVNVPATERCEVFLGGERS